MGGFYRSADFEQQINANRIEFLRTELSLSLTLVSLAETEFQIGNSEAAQRTIADAEKGYQTLSRFLDDPRHASHIPAVVMNELRDGSQKLRDAIDQARRSAVVF